MAVTPGFVVTQATTLLLIVLGAFVLTVRPRTRASVAFAAYAIAAGAGIFASNLWQASLATDATRSVAMILQLVAGTALVILLFSFPRPAPRWEQAALWAGSIAILGHGLWNARSVVGSLQSSPAAILAPLAVGAVILALRFGKEPDKAARSQLALVSAGTLPYLAMSVGDQLARSEWQRYLPQTLLLAAATSIWIVNAARVHASTRAARNVALLIPASALLGMAARAWIGDGNIDDTGLYGIARIITFAVLSYAIVRHQLLGIDVKLRFAISKSTIAAVFIAVFFVASEAAQQFFGATFSSAYVGIAVAGMLVFALAPLQRAAERLAEKAVPRAAHSASSSLPSVAAAVPIAMAAPAAPRDADRREEVFMKAARLALRGGLSRDEEVHLAELAEELGIGAGRAASLLREAEREARSGVA